MAEVFHFITWCLGWIGGYLTLRAVVCFLCRLFRPDELIILKIPRCALLNAEQAPPNPVTLHLHKHTHYHLRLDSRDMANMVPRASKPEKRAKRSEKSCSVKSKVGRKLSE